MVSVVLKNGDYIEQLAQTRFPRALRRQPSNCLAQATDAQIEFD